MVIVDMKLLSGFKLEPSSLDAVRQSASNKFPQMFINILVCTKKFFSTVKEISTSCWIQRRSRDHVSSRGGNDNMYGL